MYLQNIKFIMEEETHMNLTLKGSYF